jgi:hypothetical protein
MGEEIIGKCWHCGRPLGKADFGRENGCLGCGKATRVCRNCRHYARGRPNDCEEPMAEQVMDKERANFCDYFDPTLEPATGSVEASASDLREVAENLFK